MNFFFLILRLSHLVSARNKVEMMSFNYLSFYTIFLKFSKPGCVGMGLKCLFFFSFSGSPVPFWLGIKLEWCFFGFLNFYTIFLKFSKMGWVGTESVRIFFLILRISGPILGIDKTGMIFLIFWNFILFFVNFLNRVG